MNTTHSPTPLDLKLQLNVANFWKNSQIVASISLVLNKPD